MYNDQEIALKPISAGERENIMNNQSMLLKRRNISLQYTRVKDWATEKKNIGLYATVAK